MLYPTIRSTIAAVMLWIVGIAYATNLTAGLSEDYHLEMLGIRRTLEFDGELRRQ